MQYIIVSRNLLISIGLFDSSLEAEHYLVTYHNDYKHLFTVCPMATRTDQ